MNEADRAVGDAILRYLAAAAARGSQTDLLHCFGMVVSTALIGCAVGLRRLGASDLAALRVLEMARANERFFLELEGSRRVN